MHRVELEFFDVLRHPAQQVRQVARPIIEGVGEAKVTTRPAWVGHRHSVGDDRLSGRSKER